MDKKFSQVILLLGVLSIFLSVPVMALGQASLTLAQIQAEIAKIQEEIVEIRAAIEVITERISKLKIEIVKIENEIAEKQAIIKRAKEAGIGLTEEIPEWIIKGLPGPEVPGEEIIKPAPNAEPAPVPPAPAPSPAPTPAPAPPAPPIPSPIVCVPPILPGEHTLSISTRNNPRMRNVAINPLAVDKFASSTVRVEIQETAGQPITEVKGEARTNTMSFPFSLELISGTDTNGAWQGSWYNKDEYCQNYMIIITAFSASGDSKVEMSFR